MLSQTVYLLSRHHNLKTMGWPAFKVAAFYESLASFLILR